MHVHKFNFYELFTLFPTSLEFLWFAFCFFLCSQGIMLLILTKSGGCVPLEILSIEDVTVLKSFNHLLHRNKKVDFIEKFNEKLLVKQENENLQILDARITVVIFKYFFIHTQKSDFYAM